MSSTLTTWPAVELGAKWQSMIYSSETRSSTLGDQFESPIFTARGKLLMQFLSLSLT